MGRVSRGTLPYRRIAHRTGIRQSPHVEDARRKAAKSPAFDRLVPLETIARSTQNEVSCLPKGKHKIVPLYWMSKRAVSVAN